MKRNAFKVKYENRGRHNKLGHIRDDEYLLEYLGDFPDLRNRFAAINNHEETILVDRSLQIFTHNNSEKRFRFHPFSKFTIKTMHTPDLGQTDISSNLIPTKDRNIIIDIVSRDGSRTLPFGFFGVVSFGDFDFSTLMMGDVSHVYNSFGNDIFRELTKIVCDVWDDVSKDSEVEGYKLPPVSLGMDAEFELIKSKQTVRAGDYFTMEGEIGTDGHPATLELRPRCANESNQLLENLTGLMQNVYGQNFEIETSGDVESLGAHVHFGVETNRRFTQLLDFWVAKPLWQLNGRARYSYKRLSQVRNTDTHFGFEYRSLPSGVLKDKKLASIVLKIIEGLANDFYVNSKEISLHPCKEDYLHYISPNEWKDWQLYKKDGDRTFKGDTWDCKRKGKLYQRNVPGEFELNIPIKVYLYKLREDRGDTFYLVPHDYVIVDYLQDELENKFTVENQMADIIHTIPFDFYKIGVPYKIHSVSANYNRWLKNFITFLNTRSLDQIPEL